MEGKNEKFNLINNQDCNTSDINNYNKEYNNNLIIILKKRKNIYINIILLVVIIFIFIYSFFIPNDVRNSYKKASSKKSSLVFMKKCFEGKYLNNNQFHFSNNFKISIIIPAYNCEKTIMPVVRSIQNQNMADIEIILVNDNSKDSTSKIIQILSEEDPRITILTNKENKGTLYTRSIGILASTGKYILNLDNDDLFMDKDVFDVTYNEAENGNFDIVEFYAYDIHNYRPKLTQITISPFHNKPEGLIVRKPELLYFPISKNNETFHSNDYHVWGRLVRGNLYKKAIDNLGVNALGEKRLNNFVCWTEDISITIPLFSLAESFKFIGKNGIFHYLSYQTATHTIPTNNKYYDAIFLVDIFFDFTENNEKGKKFVVEKLLSLYKGYCSIVSKDERNVKFIKAVLNKIMNCPYISDKDKEIILKKSTSCGLSFEY